MLVPGTKNQPLYVKMYTSVVVRPTIMPVMAPALFMRLLKIPSMSTGNSEEAARPKASATTWAAKPGGLRPR
ncbi:hypothetical protein KBTX_04250 [wastewater metagenome]|uniref:Uncharacterized protein n=2 Tax=unclassified sequences TaxID=12908 RepID=A0A5B8RJY0_9ZZZZ|nr:hypothetical protein KBTEX_04250 [uncultured organism]